MPLGLYFGALSGLPEIAVPVTFTLPFGSDLLRGFWFCHLFEFMAKSCFEVRPPLPGTLSAFALPMRDCFGV